MPASTLAVSSASNRNDGVSAGKAINVRTASSQTRCRAKGSAIQSTGEPASGTDRSSDGRLRRMIAPPCRLAASGKRLRCAATPRQPSSALNKPYMAVCSFDEW